jgi:hypothetical protein
MPFLVAAIVLIGAIAALNLLLTVAMIRRLRETAVRPVAPPPDLPELPAGSRVPAFHAEAVSGETVTNESLTGSAAIFAFLDTGCSSCKSSLPKLVAYADANGLKPGQVIAVVGDAEGDTAAYLSLLDGVATVIVEETLGPVARAFSIDGFPAFVLSDADGVVTRSGDGDSTLTATRAA